MLPTGKNRFIFKWLILFAAIFFTIALSLAFTYWSYLKQHQNRVYSGVSIGGVDISRLTVSQALEKIQRAADQIRHNGIVFSYHKQNTPLYPVVLSLDSDLAIEVINFDPELSVQKAYAYGREDDIWVRLARQYEALIKGYRTTMDYEAREEQIDVFLKANFSHFERLAEDAALIHEKIGTEYEFSVNEEKYGKKLDFSRAKADLQQRLAALSSHPIEIGAHIDYPQLYKADSLNINTEAKELLAKAPLILAYERREWTISRDDLASYLQLIKDPGQGLVTVGLNADKLKLYISEKIAPGIDQEPVDPKFAMEDGKVTEFGLSQDGLITNIEKTADLVLSEFTFGTSTRIEVVAETAPSRLKEADVNDLGIRELLGSGHSSFAGSPANRRHNIAIGAAAVNGTLLAPNEEFSLLKVLGKIDKEAGYLPELVIKEGRTIPEYGGGLCQIGTTAFRGTVNAGLPVTMRRNHSYRVSYYEPAGTDATIYNPWPDYKFKNDYISHVLITARIEGDDIYFDFWGSRDGRSATATDPVIYNIVKPPPTRYIETLDLAPGQKKCTEKAHNGASAYFDYTVSYDRDNPPEDLRDQEFGDEDLIKEVRFRSHYVPWREVCLIGVEKLGGGEEEEPSEKSEDSNTSSDPAES